MLSHYASRYTRTRTSIVKILPLFLAAIFLTSAPATAQDWQNSFQANYQDMGIDQAVVIALGGGYSPDQIVKAALPIESLAREDLIKALFCGLALPGSIYEAAELNNINDTTVAKGYELALGECAREMEENLNAAVNPTTQQPELSPSKRVRGPVYSSPWKFE